MSILDKVLSKAKMKPPIICLYGKGGIGKTTFASTMNNPIIVQCEDGIGKIECPHTDVAKSYLEFESYLLALLNDEHDFKTVVVDSLDWLERLINDHVCKENGWSDIQSPSFGKGYGASLVVFKDYLDILTRLRNEKGMTILQIAHNEVKRYEDPSNDPHDKHQIKLYRKSADLVVEHADCVFFANYKTGSVQKKNAKGGMTTQVLQGDRKIYTQEAPGYHAKNRYGLPSEMDFDLAYHKGGDDQMSKLGDVEEGKVMLGEIREKLNAYIDKINPDDNSLPLDGLHWFISIEADCEDLVEHLSDYNSYDPG